jgi:hypothetical protein
MLFPTDVFILPVSCMARVSYLFIPTKGFILPSFSSGISVSDLLFQTKGFILPIFFPTLGFFVCSSLRFAGPLSGSHCF